MKKPAILIIAVVVAGVAWLILGEGLGGGLLGGSPLGSRDLLDEQGRPILVGTEDDNGMSDNAVVRDVPGEDTDVETSTGVVIEGRVLDPTRRPVEDATVDVRFGGKTRYEGTTDADGRYTIDVGGRPTTWTIGTVTATAPGPRIGSTGVALSAASADVVPVQPILLGPAHDVFILVAHGGKPIQGARVVLAQSLFGRMQPMSEGITGEDGLFGVSGVPAGNHRVFAAAEGFGRNSVALSLPRAEDGPVALTLTDERTLDVLVVEKDSGRPVEDASVFVGDRFTIATGSELGLIPPLDIPPTDNTGRTTIRGLSATDTVYVGASAEGFARPNPYIGSGRIAAASDVADVKVELGGYRTMRFPLASGGAPPPREGTTLELQFQSWMQEIVADDASARIEGGMLVVSGLPVSWITGRVDSPEDTYARFTAGMEGTTGPAVTFEPVLRARVRVTEADGTPIVGRALRFQGGFRFGRIANPVTDENGEAVLEGMTSKKVNIFLMDRGQTWGGQPLGQIDLSEEREIYVLVAEPEQTLTIRLTLDGEVRLPASYTVTVGNLPKQPNEIEEDPGAGTLLVRHRYADSGTPIPVSVRAAGFLEGKAEIEGGRSEEIALDLELGGSIIAYVEPPEDGAYMLRLQMWDPEREIWGPARMVTAQPNAPREQPGGTQTFEGLVAGRYRVLDQRSQTASNEVDVVPGGPPAEVFLDLSRMIWVEGTIVAPEGTNFIRARVFQPGQTGPWSGVAVDARGRFKLRTMRGDALTLSVKHDLLAAAKQGGTVRVVAGSGPVTLRLEAGNTLRFTLPSSDEDARGFRAAQVTLFKGSDRTDPLFSATAMADDGAFEVGGFAPGRFTVYIDAFVGAPVVLSKELGVGETDLGRVVPPRGSAIVVKLLLEPDAGRPRAWASARHQGAPTYTRTASVGPDDEHDLVVEGMVAGTVQLTVNVMDGTGAVAPVGGGGHTFTVEVDGSSDAVVEVDLR